ncbi:MAG: hypothetical protein M0P27_00545 [Bacteroidales bacterium]|nr:hypothetical protein [Bacteroidales bacterium]
MRQIQTSKKRGRALIDVIIVVLLFIAFIIIFLPMINLHTTTQRLADKQIELKAVQEWISELAQDAAKAETQKQNADRLLLEKNTLVARAQAIRETEESLRQEVLSNRLIEENLQRELAQTNHVLKIESGKIRSDMEDWQNQVQTLKNQSSDLQAGTNALLVAKTGLEQRVQRLKQEELSAEKRLEEYSLILEKLKTDKQKLEDELNQSDAELKIIQANINNIKADIQQEESRLAKLKQDQNKIQQEVDAAKAEIEQLQITFKDTQVKIATAKAQLKKALEDLNLAREAESAARIGEAGAKQRTEDARKEELALRKIRDELNKELKEIQATIRKEINQTQL